MTRRLPRLTGAVPALGLLLPAGGLADAGAPTQPIGFRLHATNGYELVALAYAPQEGTEGEIALFLVRGRHRGLSYEVAICTVPATVTDKTVDADLGRLGRISVTRVRTGRMKTVPWGCKRRRTKRIEAERYEGAIEFHGEEGFTDVSATGAPRFSSVRVGCGSGGEDGGAWQEPARRAARCRQGAFRKVQA